ncbi:MAG TPA: hypothetical protein VHV31_06270, partial [Nitrolancea sp.]|nr:hypothetical protein [Nitrolancea sp.]
MRKNYREASQITGPLTDAPEGPIQIHFRSVLTRRQRGWLALQILVNLVCSLTFLTLLILPRHFPTNDAPFDTLGSLISAIAFGLVVLLETFRLFQNATLWLFAWEMRDPIPLKPEPGLRIAVLTTIVPSKEPIELAAVTLDAMRRLDYDGQVDVWVLDEDDDPRVRALATSLGVHHFSRNG